MADNEIQILIKAVDEASSVLQSISKQTSVMAKDVTATSKTVQKGFTSQTDSLLALGNTAASVDRIFTEYQNTQIRVENAADRVANAQDRLSNAQYNLAKLQESGNASALDLSHAQQQVEMSSRSLAITMNNQERVNNAVIGTYINMGVQSLNLIKSLPQLITTVQGLTTAGLAFAATPLGIAMLAIGIAAAGLMKVMGDKKKMVEELTAANDKLKSSLDNLGTANKALSSQPGDAKKAQMELDIADKRLKIAQTQEAMRLASTGQGPMVQNGSDRIAQLQNELKILETNLNTEYVLKADLEAKKQALELTSYTLRKANADKALTEAMNAMDKIYLKEQDNAKKRETTMTMTNVNMQTDFDKKWNEMQTNSSAKIQVIISDLDKIPKEVVTIHRIKTVWS